MDKAPASERLKRTAEIPVGAADSPRPVVLVLDDEWETCEAVQEVLEDGGFETVGLNEATRALEYLADAEPLPDLILLDLMMPLMDGWTFLDELRASGRLEQVPILVLTAAGPHWEYPTLDVLHKPVDAADLVAAVRRVLAEHAAAPRNADPPTESCARDLLAGEPG
jgi:DNA-binding response OmpR family regulator